MMGYTSNGTLQTLSATRARKDITDANRRIAASLAARKYHDDAEARYKAACAQYHALLAQLPDSLATALEAGYWRIIDPVWDRTYDARIKIDDPIYAHADTQLWCASFLEAICAGELRDLVAAVELAARMDAFDQCTELPAPTFHPIEPTAEPTNDDDDPDDDPPPPDNEPPGKVTWEQGVPIGNSRHNTSTNDYLAGVWRSRRRECHRCHSYATWRIIREERWPRPDGTVQVEEIEELLCDLHIEDSDYLSRERIGAPDPPDDDNDDDPPAGDGRQPCDRCGKRLAFDEFYPHREGKRSLILCAECFAPHRAAADAQVERDARYWLENEESRFAGDDDGTDDDDPDDGPPPAAGAVPDEEVEIQELIARARLGDGEAMNEIVERCKNLVYSITNQQFVFGGITRQDLEQAGFVGLLSAVYDFGERHSNFFGLVATYVWKEIRNIVRGAGIIRSAKDTSEYYRGRRACDADGVPATPENIAARAYNMSARRAASIERAQFVDSLDAPRYPGDSNSDDCYTYFRIGDLRPTESAALDEIWREEFREVLAVAMQDLSEYQRRVTEMRFAGKSHREIAEVTGRTVKSCQDAYRKAKRKIRKALGDWQIQVPTGGAYRGVKRNKRRWNAGIFVQGEYFHLGTFVSTIEAALAYDAAALKYHGDKAVLNFPERAARAEVA